LNDRTIYVEAALTIIRAYLAAGEPKVCGAFGSYIAWSRMVRSPLIWLGQPDPVDSMESSREDDPELADIRELFTLWTSYLDLDERYTANRIIEIACQPLSPNDFNRPPFKELLLRVAGDRQSTAVLSKRLGWWLRGISGRVLEGHRLNTGRQNKALPVTGCQRCNLGLLFPLERFSQCVRVDRQIYRAAGVVPSKPVTKGQG
jgi:putative DNA primase/helicase